MVSSWNCINLFGWSRSEVPFAGRLLTKRHTRLHWDFFTIIACSAFHGHHVWLRPTWCHTKAILVGLVINFYSKRGAVENFWNFYPILNIFPKNYYKIICSRWTMQYLIKRRGWLWSPQQTGETTDDVFLTLFICSGLICSVSLQAVGAGGTSWW